jgi:hypothetical protein
VLYGSRAHHDLPLHIACRYQLNEEILQELVKDFPATAVEQTKFGRTPLMALLESRMKEEELQRQQQYLRQQEEEALGVAVGAGFAAAAAAAAAANPPTRTPRPPILDDERFWNKVMILLKAVARFREDPQYDSQRPSTRTKEFRSTTLSSRNCSQRAKLNTEATTTTTNDYTLVVHAAVSLGALCCRIEVLEYFLERFPEQTRSRDRWGLLPLHLAVKAAPWNGSTRRKYRPREQKVVAALLRVYPDAAKIPIADDEGADADHRRYPLMTALSNRHLWIGGVEELFHAAPEVLLMRDPVTLLFPFLLAAIPSGDNTTVDLDTIYNLLRAQPEVMSFYSQSVDQGQEGYDSERDGLKNSSIEQRCPTFIQDAMIGTVTAALIGVAAGIIFRVD